MSTSRVLLVCVHIQPAPSDNRLFQNLLWGVCAMWLSVAFENFIEISTGHISPQFIATETISNFSLTSQKDKGAFTPMRENAQSTRADSAHGLRSGWVYRNCVVLFTPPRVRWASAAGAHRDRSRSDSSAGPAGIGSVDWSVFIDQRPSAVKWGFSKVKLRADSH